ncbi:hypothetical protein CEXT_702701 [Caerostris extrusa]|uniref:Uncharacterized protein n=1 Tax=Caerostris extrusa TaxID=172846 RepID=A0AAV4Y8J6_CAEEX|nr:hypothetical protein CEXT_702701 [Caerostris extrusa]
MGVRGGGKKDSKSSDVLLGAGVFKITLSKYKCFVTEYISTTGKSLHASRRWQRNRAECTPRRLFEICRKGLPEVEINPCRFEQKLIASVHPI